MKRFITLLVALISIFATSMAQKRLFADIASLQGVSSVYMGSELMQTMGMQLRLGGYGLNSDFVREAEVLETITAEANIPQVRNFCKSVLDNQNLEIILETHDDGDATYIYVGKNIQEQFTDRIFVVSDEPDEYSIIYIKGKIHLPTLIARYGHVSF